MVYLFCHLIGYSKLQRRCFFVVSVCCNFFVFASACTLAVAGTNAATHNTSASAIKSFLIPFVLFINPSI